MENIIRPKSLTMPLVKAVVTALSIAFVYWSICMMTPELSKSSVAGLYFAKSLKLANMLRAFVLVSPYAVVGTGIGAWLFNLTTGTAALSAYPVLPIIITLIGLGFYRLSAKVGRSLTKDLTILTLFGLVTGTIVALNLTSFAVLAGGLSLASLKGLILAKILLNTLTVLAGYPLVKLFGKYFGEEL